MLQSYPKNTWESAVKQYRISLHLRYYSVCSLLMLLKRIHCDTNKGTSLTFLKVGWVSFEVTKASTWKM